MLVKWQAFYRPQRSWGKVIFSEACVKNSVHSGRGGMHGRGVCMVGACMAGGCIVGGHAWQGVCGRGGGFAWWGACMAGGACVAGHAWHTCPPADTVRYSQWAGSTHPTGMHSCSLMFFILKAFDKGFTDKLSFLKNMTILLSKFELFIQTKVMIE